jgi:hypothetical protein
VRHRLRSRLPCRVPPRAPRRVASPNQPARRLPRHGALGRALQPIRRSQSTANTMPLFRVAAQSLDENQAARAAENEKPCPSLTRPAPGLVPPPRHAFLLQYQRQRTIPFSFCRRDFTSTVQGLLVPLSGTAFHLEPFQFYLFGLLDPSAATTLKNARWVTKLFLRVELTVHLQVWQ